jgi:hypothetical protein
MPDTVTLGALLPPPQADSTRVDIETMSRRNLEGMGWEENFEVNRNIEWACVNPRRGF